MIKSYNLFLLENVKLSNDDIIEIIKSLETGDNKNSKLINKLVNNVDNNGKTLLMNLAQKNKTDLVDYILKFNVDVNAKNKKNENVLFFCKNVNMFNKFYNMGADPTLISSFTKKNVMLNLASKNIFNLDLYKRLIGDGVDINKKDRWNNIILEYAVFNQKILELLVSKNVKFDENIQMRIIRKLLYKFKYWPKDRKMVINKFKYLSENGLNVDNEKFAKDVDGYIMRYGLDKDFDVMKDFILPLVNPLKLNDKFFNTLIELNYNNVEFLKIIIENFPQYYKKIKGWYGSSFELNFRDFLDEHPYIEDSDKYNI